jgi:excisionase family DNA binding protein
MALLLHERLKGKYMRSGMQMATVREVAALLRLKESTVCSLVSRGKLPGSKIGKSWRFDLEKIERLLDANCSGTNRPAGGLKNTEEA